MTLPTFIVIGVAKGGTTSIYRYLDQHPDVFMCPDKGPNFFGYEDARNWQWHEEGEPPLLRHFKVSTLEEYEALFAGVTDERAVGEVSPQYFRCPTAARRIHEVIPDVKLVASLRNPADRAFSGFLMRTRRGETVDDAHVELTAESSHVKEGFYYTRMKRFYDAFDREQIKIYLFDEFGKRPGRSRPGSARLPRRRHRLRPRHDGEAQPGERSAQRIAEPGPLPAPRDPRREGSPASASGEDRQAPSPAQPQPRSELPGRPPRSAARPLPR